MSVPTAASARCAAAVTVFRPDAAILHRLLGRLGEEGLATLVHVDGPVGEAIEAAGLDALRAVPGLTVLQAERNGGIGRALNRLAAAAAEAGYERVLFLDQDSDLPAGTPGALAAAFDKAAAAGRVAAVGPLPVAPPAEDIQPPRYRRRSALRDAAPLAAVDFLITSGSLVSLDAWRVVGPFREDFFIDAIDVEWCFRAWDRGYAILLDPTLALPHRIGGGVVRFGPLGFPDQTDARMASYVRNQAHLLRLPHVPLRWKLRTLAYVPLQIALRALAGPHRSARLKRFAGAAAAGLRGRFEDRP